MSMSKQKRRRANTGILFVLPGLLGFGLFYVWSMILCGYYSINSSTSGWSFVGLHNYIELFRSSAFRLAVKNTLLFLLTGIPFLLLLSIILAFGLHDILSRISVRWSDFLFSSYLLPMVMSAAPVMLVLQILFGSGGVLNSGKSFWVLMLVFLWRNAGYIVVLLSAGIGSVEKDMVEAAKMDGAGFFRQVVNIYLPNMRNVIFFSVFMGVAGIFKIYRDSYFLLGEYPHDAAYMIQNFLNNN